MINPSIFPGQELPARGIPGWHGGERHRRDGGGPAWGGPGFPSGAQAVPYANPCPDPRMIYDAYSDRCYLPTDPFAGSAGSGRGGMSGFGVGNVMGPGPDGQFGSGPDGDWTRLDQQAYEAERRGDKQAADAIYAQIAAENQVRYAPRPSDPEMRSTAASNAALAQELATESGPSSRPTASPETLSDRLRPRSGTGKTLAVGAVVGPLLGLVSWPVAIGAYVASRFVEPLR